jgi:hypothetical protein
MWIPMGLVENIDANVIIHICCESKAKWDIIQNNVSTCDGMPDSIDAFIKSLQSSDV